MTDIPEDVMNLAREVWSACMKADLGWSRSNPAEVIARAIIADRAAQAERMARLPATGPYVERIIRIFRDRPDDDTSAVVLTDYARAARALSQEGSDA